MGFFEMLLAVAAAFGFYWFALAKNSDGMTRWQQMRLGKSLSDMTTVFERIEATRLTMPIGAGGGFDSLTPYQQKAADKVFSLGERRVRMCGPVVTTREMLKNMRLASSLGRVDRVEAQAKLLARLQERGLAVPSDWFL